MKRILLFTLVLSIFIMCLPGCQTKNTIGFSENWEVGYGESEIYLNQEEIENYYVAGYKMDNHATGVLDVPKVKAVFLHAGNECILLIAVDCIALASGDVSSINKKLSSISKKTGCEIFVFATHTHAGVDTLGLWGKVAVNGKNSQYMDSLYEACRVAGENAFESRKEGALYYGSTSDGILDLQEDSRDPQVYDKELHQLRFVPKDGSNGIRIINYAAHAESLRGDNSLISADFPAYLSSAIKEKTGDDTVFIQGAIGGLIMTKRLTDDNGDLLPVEENCKKTGKLLASATLSIENEYELSPYLFSKTQKLSIPVDNDVFVAMKSFGILSSSIRAKGEGRNGVTMQTTVSRICIGDLEIVTIPGEIFPELVYGDDNTISSIVGSEFLIFGLCNDEIGYIIPEESFLLNEERPYIDTITDSTGENHYEETNSVSEVSAQLILDAIAKLYN